MKKFLPSDSMSNILNNTTDWADIISCIKYTKLPFLYCKHVRGGNYANIFAISNQLYLFVQKINFNKNYWHFLISMKAQSFQSVELRMKLRTRLLLHQFCLTLLSERGESNKTNAKKVSYKGSYEASLTTKTRLKYN